ncbi:hypothetical protein SAMN04489761_4245 [Tenacibaculum sp. MAR_2009_124]|nr:hypothetical protein SAMN04489761_4245 [Tenacibaculum sp. MAR_2009_124]
MKLKTKKIIAREFLILLFTLTTSALIAVLEIIINDRDFRFPYYFQLVLVVLIVISIPVFILRYVYYSVKWGLKNLEKVEDNIQNETLKHKKSYSYIGIILFCLFIILCFLLFFQITK